MGTSELLHVGQPNKVPGGYLLLAAHPRVYQYTYSMEGHWKFGGGRVSKDKILQRKE